MRAAESFAALMPHMARLPYEARRSNFSEPPRVVFVSACEPSTTVLSAMLQLELPTEAIAAFCRKWRIRELAVFGSILREDFRPDSDVDVLVSFEAGAPWSTFDLLSMQEELEGLFGRRVDLVEKEGLRNPFRRHTILQHREVLYAA